MIESIEEESKFHTIVLMRTKEVWLAERFPHVIFTKENRISYSEEENVTDFEYNIEIDAAKYSTDNSNKFIMADLNPISKVFDQSKLKNLLAQAFLDCRLFQEFKYLQFYLYLQNGSFVTIKPLIILQKSIMFQLDRSIEQLKEQDQYFKRINLCSREDQKSSENVYYHFTSEYGLLSDLHFMNNFVRGYRGFSCYKKNRTIYTHIINAVIFDVISSLFVTPKL